jgi:uncharacterized membrane protein
MSETTTAAVGWELVLQRSWRRIVLTFLAALAVASFAWQLGHPGFVYEFIFRPDAISRENALARHALLPLAAVAAGLATLLGARTLRQARRGRTSFPLHREMLVTSLMGLPLLGAPTAEFDHPWFVSAAVVLMAFALARAVAKELEARGASRLPDLTDRQAKIAVGVGFAVFAGVMGFLAHWRFITFHAEPCDASWEIGAVSGILRHGIPTASFAAWLYEGKALPAPYFNNHVPWVDYLFVPFYLVWRDARVLFWVQAAFMGTGAFGAYMIGRRWLERRAGGVLAAFVYLLNPSVQSFCLHDIHANVLIIPALLLTVGFMEAERQRLALGFALLTVICREEAPIYAAAIGTYWMFSGEDRRRFRVGLLVLGAAIAYEAFVVGVFMPLFGGHPRQDHFNLYFDGNRNHASMLGALVLNPVGAAFSSTADYKLEYLAITLLSVGGLAMWGLRAAWFLIPTLLILVPAGDPGFFSLGMNYSAPIVPGAVMMGLAGLRRLWTKWEGDVPRRVGLGVYVLATALAANYLYGNIGSKTVKLEYGQSPFRRENQRDFRDTLGYVEALPPYGPAEKALWDVVRRVPYDGPVLASWTVHPQISDHDVTFVYSYSGATPAIEARARYIIIDKLPAMQTSTEADILRLRADMTWKILYENASGVLFERRNP